jgi:uncharacterized protein HemX
VAAEPAISTLAQTVLGALLIIAVLVAVFAIYTLIKVQNARVLDQKEMSDRLEASHTKMMEAFTGFRATLTSLEKTEETSQSVMGAMRDQLVNLAAEIRSCPRRG